MTVDLKTGVVDEWMTSAFWLGLGVEGSESGVFIPLAAEVVDSPSIPTPASARKDFQMVRRLALSRSG